MKLLLLSKHAFIQAEHHLKILHNNANYFYVSLKLFFTAKLIQMKRLFHELNKIGDLLYV